jgi:hypothetical protein
MPETAKYVDETSCNDTVDVEPGRTPPFLESALDERVCLEDEVGEKMGDEQTEEKRLLACKEKRQR